MTDLRAAVARYIELGLRPIPMWGVDGAGRCRCGGYDARTRKPCNAGKHSPHEVEQNWKSRRYGVADFDLDDNVAVALGPYRPGQWLVCLDVDGPEAASVFFPELPPTMLQQSPRGRHLFYTVAEYAPLGNWVDCLATKYGPSRTGIDVRYARGRINVAPSVSAFGAYTWVSRLGDPAPLPASVMHRILDERRRRGLPVESHWHRDGKRP